MATVQSAIVDKLPYVFNSSQNISNFNRKFVYDGYPVSATMQHTGVLTLRAVKHGGGNSLYMRNQNNTLLDSYDNYNGNSEHQTGVIDSSITLTAWVKKGDVITLTSNLPSTTSWEDTFFCQTGLLAYNSNYD